MFGFERRGKEPIVVDPNIKMSLPLVVEALREEGVELFAFDPQQPDIQIPLKTDGEGHLQMKVGKSWLIASTQENFGRLNLAQESIDLLKSHKEKKAKGFYIAPPGARRAAPPEQPDEQPGPLQLSDGELVKVQKFLNWFVYGTELLSEEGRDLMTRLVKKEKGPWLTPEKISSVSSDTAGVHIETSDGRKLYYQFNHYPKQGEPSVKRRRIRA